MITFNVTRNIYKVDKTNHKKTIQKIATLNLQHIIFYPDGKSVYFYTNDNDFSLMPCSFNTLMAVPKKVGKLLKKKYIVFDAF